VVAALVIAAVVVLGGDEAEAEVFLEPAGSAGQDPFTDSIVTDVGEEAGARLAEGEGEGDPPDDVADGGDVDGSTPELYGGSGELAVCDTEAMLGFLEDNEDEAEAWAGVIGIDPGDIDDYVDGLTPVLLQADTRVTNNGFRDGEAVPFQSVLQAGTAVLVDDEGVPRVRCECGNPLGEPEDAGEDVTGDAWDDFDPEKTVTVTTGDQVDVFVITDVETGDRVDLPVGGPEPEPELDGDAVAGRWTGTYVCSQGETGLDLTIEDEGDGDVSATFAFHAIESNPTVPSGSYTMSGGFQDGSLVLEPEGWIEQPSGYELVGLTSDPLDDDGEATTTLSGQVDGPGCTDFDLTRSTIDIEGTWRAETVDQDPPVAPYGLEVTFTPSGADIRYFGGDLECSGVWLLSEDGDRLVGTEQVTTFDVGSCVETGTVTLTRIDEDTIDFHWDGECSGDPCTADADLIRR